MKAHEIRQQKLPKVAEARKIINAAASENREMTAEERSRFDALEKEIQALESRAVDLSRFEVLEAGANSNGNVDAQGLPHNDPRNTRNGVHRYSVVRALSKRLAQMEGTGKFDGLEMETHLELQKRRARPAQGVLIPWDLRVNRMDRRTASRFASANEYRDLTQSTGTGSIATILDPTLIDILRTRMAVEAAGATVLADLDGGLFAIPRQSGASTFQWVAEGSAASGTNQTIDQVAFSPKTATAWTNYTRRFLELSNQSAEDFVRMDLLKVVARGIDAAATFGTGSSYQPTGVANVSGIGSVALGTNGGVPTYAALVSLETQVSIANADFGSLSYMTNAQGRSTLKQTLKVGSSTFPIYLWDVLPPVDGVPKGLVNGYEAWVTNQLPATLTKGSGSNLSPILFGNWEDLIIAMWGGMDTIIDPYSGSTTGSVKVVVLQDADINVRHPQSFAAILDMITS